LKGKIIIYIMTSFLVLFVVVWGILVFELSNQDVTESHELSRIVIELILEKKDKIDAIIENYKITKKIDFTVEPTIEITAKRIYELQFLTRKFAHFSLYAIGSFLIYMATTAVIKEKTGLKVLITLTLGIVYAVSDEFHQKFIEGRTSNLSDVGIDTLGNIAGVLIAIFVVFILNKIISYIYKKHERRDKNA